MIELAARYLHLAASLILFGAALFPHYACGADAARALLLRWSARAALLAVLTSALLHAAAIQPALIGETVFGKTALAQIALLAVLVLLKRKDGALAVALAGAQLALFALVSHANAIAGLPGATWQTLHLLAASGWAGGLAALWLALRQAPSHAIAQRFSRAGYFFVVLIAFSGALVLHTNTGAWTPLLGTEYGWIAAAKIGAFIAAVLLALFNRVIAAPRTAWTLLGRVVIGELALMALLAGLGLSLSRAMPYG